MEEYQTITLTETYEELTVGTMEYPLMLAGIFYIKFIVYNEDFDIDENTNIGKWIYVPSKFITLLPQNILKRENIWSQEEEDIIKNAAEEARIREATIKEYRKAEEKEEIRKSQEILTIPNFILDDIDDDIDPDFKTKMNPTDPNYG